MKNIHALPTDKPSKIGQSIFDKSLYFNPIFNYKLEKERVIPQNIYLTSDEEIEEGDWFYNPRWKEIGINYNPDGCKKIILTTDPDLINDDGVQAIEDEFLEWFVQNPSCDFVEVERGYLGMGGFCKSSEIISKDKIHYKIIIPKEEPKQELEEAALRFYPKVITDPYDPSEDLLKEERTIFIEGAKWQQERSYSEEEVLELLRKAHFVEQNIDEWFEQFKK